MKTLNCLSIVVLAALFAVPDWNNRFPTAFSQDGMILPLFNVAHATELLDSNDLERIQLSPQMARSVSRNYARYVHKRTRELLPKKWRSHYRRIAKTLIQEANRHQLDPLFLMAVINQESRFRPEVIGTSGEVGLMQIRPSTARWLLTRGGSGAPELSRVRQMLLDPVANIRYGASYLALLREKFKGQRHHYISAYNMGPGNVRAHLKRQVQPRIYSDKVLSRYVGFLAEFTFAHQQPTDRKVASID